MNQLKRFNLNEDLFCCILEEGDPEVRVISGLPKGSKFVRWFHDQVSGRIEVVVFNEQFPELKDGDPIPRIGILFEKIK